MEAYGRREEWFALNSPRSSLILSGLVFVVLHADLLDHARFVFPRSVPIWHPSASCCCFWTSRQLARDPARVNLYTRTSLVVGDVNSEAVVGLSVFLRGVAMYKFLFDFFPSLSVLRRLLGLRRQHARVGVVRGGAMATTWKP